MSGNVPEVLEAVARTLSRCESLLFVTGAGISADSGLPTYRGIGGLYDVDVVEDGLPIEEILSGPTLRRRPELAWKYLAQIADAARGARPNRAHEVIALMERRFDRVWTLTQNVDGLHRAAGARNVIEIHGNMRSLSCTACRYALEADDDTRIAIPPRCPECDAVLRPDVVLFGESLPDAALATLDREAAAGFDAVLSVGTSGLFPYIQAPLMQARRLGIPTVEINPDETILSPVVEFRLPMRAAEAFDRLWHLLHHERIS